MSSTKGEYHDAVTSCQITQTLIVMPQSHACMNVEAVMTR
jgi:hypothetical protein